MSLDAEAELRFPPFELHFPKAKWTLPTVLRHWATTRPEWPFLQWTDVGIPLTFGEVDQATDRLAAGLTAHGVTKGDLVAIFLPNCLDYILLWFALNKIGAAEVTIGEPLKGSFLRHPLALSGVATVIVSHELSHRLAPIEAELPALCRAILWTDPEAPDKDAATFARLSCSRYEDLLTSPHRPPDVDVQPSDLAAVLFTSGTTGPAKGVLMPHAQLYFMAESICQVTGLREGDVYMTAFPFFHANAQVLSIYCSLIVGIRCVLYRKFSASGWLSRARRSGATVTNCLGTVLAFIAAQPVTAHDRDHRIRTIYNAPTAPSLAAVFAERFGITRIVEGFGQTEISMPFLTPPGLSPLDNACGVLLNEWFEVRLADPVTGTDCALGQAGELLVRHNVPGTISDGFLGMPEATLASRRDLWFHTGDVLRRDAQGWYFFVDRLKDTLRRGGENISSFEVEEALKQYPAVMECAVIAVPSSLPGGEDEVKACLVLYPDVTFDPAELITWCGSQMPSFAVPRYVEVLDTLPRTPSEKIRKAVLRADGVTSRTWDRLTPSQKDVS